MSALVVAAAVLGAIVGSFLNALSFRLSTGHSIAHGRSQCMRCGHVLGALDLVPILSWVWLGGRCRYCHTRISAQYPLVEAAAAALTVGVYLHTADVAQGAVWFVAWMTLLFAFVYDMRHKVIPWGCIVLLGVLGLIEVWLQGFALWSWLAGPLVAAPLLLISLLSMGRWMGWGDGLMELGLGWLLGITPGYSALMLAFWSGAAVGIGLMVVRRGYTMKTELPFAPFLIAGAAAAYFLHVDIFQTIPALFS